MGSGIFWYKIYPNPGVDKLYCMHFPLSIFVVPGPLVELNLKHVLQSAYSFVSELSLPFTQNVGEEIKNCTGLRGLDVFKTRLSCALN